MVRTHYDVLGVSADTPDVVIKAAYRALAKEYHPDGLSTDPEAADKFIEIQNAYAVLSKHDSRSAYDAELRENLLAAATLPGHASHAAGHGTPAEHSSAEVERISARLGLYSEALAHAFHEAYLRGECGEDPARHAAEMEKSFFQEYFGEDADVQALARLLLLGSRTGAAQTLNQLMAGDMSSPVKDVRGVLTRILDQHFPDDALFIEWLKVKFGILTLEPSPPKRATEPRAVAPSRADASAPPPRRTTPAHPSRPVRSLAHVFIWAVALYFTLFAALPLMR